MYNILADMSSIQAVNYLDDFIIIGATLEETTWAHQSRKVYRILYVMGEMSLHLPRCEDT